MREYSRRLDTHLEVLTMHLRSTTLNWSPVMSAHSQVSASERKADQKCRFVAILILAAMYYVAYARHVYTGPVAIVKRDV